jgi:hypothetical protein
VLRSVAKRVKTPLPPEVTDEGRRRQRDQFPAAIRGLVLDDQRLRDGIC